MMRMGWRVLGGFRMKMALIGAVAGLAANLACLPLQANPFDTVISVNGRVVTQYEFDQRVLFMRILNQPGDLAEMARTTLIDDRLRLSAAKEVGLKLTSEQIMAGMTEFAARANLSAEEFVKITSQMGLDAESFRDFVEAGMAWREVVRAKYAGTVTITESEIDRAIANFQPTGAIKLKLIELVLPAAGEDQSAALALARKLQSQITSEADFLAAARANGGGATGWTRLSDLPDGARNALERQAPSSMTRPVALEDKIVIYWVAERSEDPIGNSPDTWVDYAQFLLPEGPNVDAEVAAVRARVDKCDDLYTVAKGLPADRLTRESKPQSSVAGDVGAVLSTLDAGETAARISRGGWRVMVMLCSRGPAPDLVPNRDIIREQLLNQRLAALAEIYLEELRSEAIITEE